MIEFTHPSVLAGIAASATWADPEMDPTRIDWAARQAAAAVPFTVVAGRPVHPHGPGATGVRYGRNELGHWGEQLCADAIVTARTACGSRWLLLIERSDGHGWAAPGGYVDPGENPTDAAVRELAEETGLHCAVRGGESGRLPARVVPDPRGSDEAWMVTTPVRIDLGFFVRRLPAVVGDDAYFGTAWIKADSYALLVSQLAVRFGGYVFAAHRELIGEFIGGAR